MNFNLIKCGIGIHKYSNPIKNETLNTIECICIYCNKILTILKKNKKLGIIKQYELIKIDIIDDIKSNKLMHARQKLNILIKNLGY